MRFWQLGNYLDLELVSVQPRNPNAGEGRVGRFAPVWRRYVPDPLEVRLRVHHENGGVDHVVEVAASGGEDRIEVLEGAPHLRLQAGLHRAVFAAAHLS